nr:hypothetical protein [Candidatus Burarchaeum sp.]
MAKNERIERSEKMRGIASPPLVAAVEEDEGIELGGNGEAGAGVKVKGERPDFRVVQAGSDIEGKATFANVGGMWRQTSKAGNEFYTLRIGKLKLLVFPNKGKTA